MFFPHASPHTVSTFIRESPPPDGMMLSKGKISRGKVQGTKTFSTTTSGKTLLLKSKKHVVFAIVLCMV